MVFKFTGGLWLSFASVAMSLSWLLPNHSDPWKSFHTDAWTAFVITLLGVVAILRARGKIAFHGLALWVFAASFIPWAQYAAGKIPFFGVAWINAAYLFGLGMCILIGALWEREAPGLIADFLFLAIGIASVVSIGLQLYQWFGLDFDTAYIMYSTGSRHFGNMAQPNLLASLLILGVLACGWGFFTRRIGATVAFVLAFFLLFGVALTESRTAQLNAVLLLTCLFLARRMLPSRKFLFASLVLGLLFLMFVLALPRLNDLLGASGIPVQFRSVAGDTRFEAWQMFLEALQLRPWFGYGWGQLGFVQFLTLDLGISLGGSMQQSHNLFLDILLWNGVPLGLCLIAVLTWYLVAVIRRISTFSQLMLAMFVLVLGTHAMLEYPLQYAFFLLPTGLVLGALFQSEGVTPVAHFSKWTIDFLILASTTILAISVRDYFRVETSYYGLRFELKKIPTNISSAPPEVLSMTQWRRYIEFARLPLTPNLTEAQLLEMSDLVQTTPSTYVLYRYSAQLAANDKVAASQRWLKMLCRVSPPEHCAIIKSEWAVQSLTNPKIAAVAWPL